jgi:hypothetical protein
VDLAFLKPTSSEIYEATNDNPYQLFDTAIKINGVPNKMGVYIVDLQAETITSRAVIRKGEIYCVDRFSTEGQVLCFYDQDGQPITEK